MYVTLPPLESYLNWVTDPMPPPARRPDDLPKIRRLQTPLTSFRDACDLDDAWGSSRLSQPMTIRHPA